MGRGERVKADPKPSSVLLDRPKIYLDRVQYLTIYKYLAFVSQCISMLFLLSFWLLLIKSQA